MTMVNKITGHLIHSGIIAAHDGITEAVPYMKVQQYHRNPHLADQVLHIGLKHPANDDQSIDCFIS